MTKIGRPTDVPKNEQVRVRLTDDEYALLLKCVESSSLSKSDVIRRGIRLFHDELMDSRTAKLLEDCAKVTGKSKDEIIKDGIRISYEGLLESK